jgi:uncharacterized repeat protein (TIGR03803 family)
MFRTKVTEVSAPPGFAPAGKPGNADRLERFGLTKRRASMKRTVNAFLSILHGRTGESVLWRRLGIFGALAILPAMAQVTGGPSPLTAPVLTTLHSFAGGSDGATPYNEAVIGSSGELYGTTSAGGGSNDGTVFMLTPPGTTGGSWTETVLHAFHGSDGSLPQAGVVIGPGGVLYGTAEQGGSSSYGVVFSLTPPASPGGSWTETTLYTFTGGDDGGDPRQLVVGSAGLYGTTDAGGPSGQGTVFSLTPPASPGGSWTKTTLYAFAGGSDGAVPYGGVAIGVGGVLYGTTFFGGSSNAGTVFSLTPPASPGDSWTETLLHTFTGGSDAANPYVGVTIGSGGVLYGTTQYGGTSGSGTVFAVTPPTSAGGLWTETVLQSFAYSGLGGQGPVALIVIRPGGNVCSTAPDGGASDKGVVFCLEPPVSPGGAWTEVVLHSFRGSDGANPVGAVTIGAGKVFYGTTSTRGASNYGTVYQLRL